MRSLFFARSLKQLRCGNPDVAGFLLVDDKREKGLVQGLHAQEVATMQGRLNDPKAFSAHFEAAIDETSSQDCLPLLSLRGTVIGHRPASAEVLFSTREVIGVDGPRLRALEGIDGDIRERRVSATRAQERSDVHEGRKSGIWVLHAQSAVVQSAGRGRVEDVFGRSQVNMRNCVDTRPLAPSPVMPFPLTHPHSL